MDLVAISPEQGNELLDVAKHSELSNCCMVLIVLLVTKDTFQKQFNVSERERTDGIPSRRWENNIKVDLK